MLNPENPSAINAHPLHANAVNPLTTAWMAEYEQRAVRHTVTVGEQQVVWRQFGEGEPLVLIHGGHGSWMHWAANIEALSKHFSLWIPDLAGYGDSSDPYFDDFSTMVDVTAECLTQLFGAQTPFNLAGFSFGGLVSANVAAKGLPVRRLALLGPGGHGGPRRERGTLINWKRAETEADFTEAMRFNLWAHMLYADEKIDAFAMGIHTHSCINTRFRSRGISGRGLLGPALDAYAGETFLIWGEHDVTCTPEYLMTHMVSEHAQRHGVILPDVGHWVNYEAIEPVNALLTAWFKHGQTGI